MADLYVVQSKVKELLKKKGCNTSAKALEALSKEVETWATKAVERAKANGRKTIFPQDV